MLRLKTCIVCVMLLPFFGGCALMKQIQSSNSACDIKCNGSNSTCRSPDCERCSNSHLSSVDGHHVNEASEFAGESAGNIGQLVEIHETLNALASKQDSLQEQLAMMDRKTEKNMEQQEGVVEIVDDLTKQVAYMKGELANQDVEIDGIETNLNRHHNMYDSALISIEKTLGSALEDYQNKN